MDDLFGAALVLLLAVPAYFISRIEQYGWHRATSKWARKLDRRLEEMFRADDFLASGLFQRESFRWDCADFLEAKRKAARTESDRKAVESYYLSDRGFYTMVATRAYRQLLFSPFALYSALSWEQKGFYEYTFKYAMDKLIALGSFDDAFYEKAKEQLRSVEDFCDGQKKSGAFVEW